MTTKIEIVTGKDCAEYVDIVSQFRIEAFREYPYLYEGKIEYEKKYLLGYMADTQGMIAVAKVDGVLAGISTGIPLNGNSEIVADAKKIFRLKNIDISDYYYYGEIIVKPEFRRRSLAKMLYAAQDNLIIKWRFKHASILTIMRDKNHFLKPADYQSPDKMWEHLGFTRNQLKIDYSWPTIQADHTVKNISNTLEFWTKPLVKKIVD